MPSPTVPLLRLARITHGDPGRCSCCDADAVVWHRTGIIADGRITVAARYCSQHDPDSSGTGQRLGTLTIADVARLSPRRAARAARMVAQAEQRAEQHSRMSSALRGASSATHTHALFAGVAEAEARTYEALAAALETTR